MPSANEASFTDATVARRIVEALGNDPMLLLLAHGRAFGLQVMDCSSLRLSNS